MFQVSALERKYSWINEEKKYFGTPGGAYDFKESDPHEAGKRLSKLQEKSEKLGRNINTRAMNLLGKEEEQVVSWLQFVVLGFGFTSFKFQKDSAHRVSFIVASLNGRIKANIFMVFHKELYDVQMLSELRKFGNHLVT
jgi:hypothetical protein